MARRHEMQDNEILEALQQIDRSYGVFSHPAQDKANNVLGRAMFAISMVEDAMRELNKTSKDLNSLDEQLRKSMNENLNSDQRNAIQMFRGKVLKVVEMIDKMRELKRGVKDLEVSLPETYAKVQRLF
jgi:hypothetical protein